MARKFYTCIIVPHASQHLHKLHIPERALYLLAVIGAVSFFVAVGLGFNYLGMASRMANFETLQEENAELKVSTRQLKLTTTKLDRQLTALETETERITKVLEADPLLRQLGKLGGSTGGSKENVPTAALGRNVAGDVDGIKLRMADVEKQLSLLDDKARWLRSTPTIWPLEGRFNSHYGSRLDPFTGEAEVHLGVDIEAQRGTPIKATADGVVLFARRQAEYGNLVVIEHPNNGFTTRYAHLSGFKVGEKQEVHKGDVIGWVGMTGRATAPHLHYEVRLNDRPVNPRPYLER